MASKAASRTNVLLTLGVLFTIGAASRLVPSNVAAASDGGALGTGLSSSTIAAAAATPEHAPVKSKITDITGQICFSEDLAETMAADQLRCARGSNKLRPMSSARAHPDHQMFRVRRFALRIAGRLGLELEIPVPGLAAQRGANGLL